AGGDVDRRLHGGAIGGLGTERAGRGVAEDRPPGIGARGNHQAVRPVYGVGEQPRAALLRSERRRVEGDGRLTYVVVVQRGESRQIPLAPRPDLDLCKLRWHHASPCGRTGYCMITKVVGRVGNSVPIQVVVSYGCRAPEKSPKKT